MARQTDLASSVRARKFKPQRWHDDGRANELKSRGPTCQLAFRSVSEERHPCRKKEGRKFTFMYARIDGASQEGRKKAVYSIALFAFEPFSLMTFQG